MRIRKFGIFLLLFLLPTLVLAQGTPIPNYQPLEPLPFLSGISKPSFAQLMSGLFQLAMVAGAVLAVLMITYGGIQYMTSDVLGTKEAGRSRIKNAVLGFLLLLAIYIILYTINPQLLDFNLSSIKNVGALFQTQYPSTTNTNTTIQSIVTNPLSTPLEVKQAEDRFGPIVPADPDSPNNQTLSIMFKAGELPSLEVRNQIAALQAECLGPQVKGKWTPVAGAQVGRPGETGYICVK